MTASVCTCCYFRVLDIANAAVYWLHTHFVIWRSRVWISVCRSAMLTAFFRIISNPSFVIIFVFDAMWHMQLRNHYHINKECITDLVINEFKDFYYWFSGTKTEFCCWYTWTSSRKPFCRYKVSPSWTVPGM